MDATTSLADATPEQPVVFRGKKRKLFRQRPAVEETTTSEEIASEANEKHQEGGARHETSRETEEDLSVADLIRQRNARKSRLKGIGFGAGDAQTGGASADDELSLMIREEEQKAIDLANGGVNKRFTAQTGLSSDLVDKHMMEYIESELAKRKSTAPSSHGASQSRPSDSGNHVAKTTHEPWKHPAMQGTLQEIDLGHDARSKNEAMTEQATRKLQGEAVESEQSSRPKKPRLGRDGKPWRSRNRRGSDDIKRDQLVEEILRENRLDVYESPNPRPVATAGQDDDGAADDRIAEEFRREFMEAMAERHHKKKPIPGAKKDEEVLKGPKLGGSRNARAAMRDLMLKKEKESRR